MSMLDDDLDRPFPESADLSIRDDPTITITYEGTVDLKVSDVWPDGDAPDVITADDVVLVMEQSGRKERVLSDWLLLDELEVQVAVSQENPAWSGDDVLFGEPPARWSNTFGEAWA